MGGWLALVETEKSSERVTFEVKMQVILLKISFYFKCVSHIFATPNQLPGFFITKRGEFSKCKYKCKYKLLFFLNIFIHAT